MQESEKVFMVVRKKVERGIFFCKDYSISLLHNTQQKKRTRGARVRKAEIEKTATIEHEENRKRKANPKTRSRSLAHIVLCLLPRVNLGNP